MIGVAATDQDCLFYEFRLEDRIPENYLLRRFNVFVTVAFADRHDSKDNRCTSAIEPRWLLDRDIAWLGPTQQLCEQLRLSTAVSKALGLTIPPTLLIFASEVIE